MKKLNPTTGETIELCAVCRVILGPHNKAPETPQAFHTVCTNHEQHANTFLIDFVAESLKYKDREKRSCSKCGQILSKKQQTKAIELNSFHFLCSKHLKKYAKCYVL